MNTGTITTTEIANRLSKWACQIAGRFASPVYLVGSILTNPRARDVDVVVVLSDRDFHNRYGLTADETQEIGDVTNDWQYQRYWQDIAKMTRWAAYHHNLNLDFKVQDESYVRRHGHHLRDKERLDCLNLEEK